MSQKNSLNIHVIKTKRIECAKLDLPAMLAQPRKTPTKDDGFTTPRPEASSLQTSNHNPSNSEVNLRRQTDSRSSLTDSLSPKTNDVPSTPEADEDVVFDDSLETPSEAFAKPIKRDKARCLSLPACLGAESEGADERSVCLRPRRLFEEALNLERSRSAAPRGTSRHVAGLASNEFARGRETAGRQGEAAEDKEVKRRRTWRAGIVREKEALELITDHNNNNSSLRERECVPNYTAIRSHSTSDLRRDWEQKILGLTESRSEFGTERGGASYEDEGSRTRPRSVTLAGSVHAFVEAREKAKAREAKRRAKSAGKHRGMPKFQTVVWDYIKRRSSKRKGKRDGGTKEEDSSKPRHSTNEDSASCFPPVEQLKKDTTSVVSGHSVSRRSTVSEIPESPSLNSDQASPSLGKWKSTPNLASSEATEYAERILQRNNPWDELDSRTDRAKTPVKELKEEPEILRLLLTTNSELRPMEERLKTLALAREWLVKELNVMRVEDRRLARQFINLRSAIMEIRRAREKEDSDCESDGEERKSKRIDSKRLAADQERHINDHGYHMHVTPTRNILSYC